MRLNNQSICLPAPQRPTRGGLGGLALLVLLAGTAPATEPGTKASFVSGGKEVRVERFEPDKKGKYPAVVLLYGVDGLHTANEAIFRGGARTVANRGFVVLLVHYHDRTAASLKDPRALLKHFQEGLRNPEANGKEQQALRKTFDAWTEAVRDAVAHARALPSVDGDRVALVGFSLGGFLAATVAAEPQQRIGAVVTMFGGIPGHTGARLEHFPHALIVGGDKDDIVPVKESYYLIGLLRAKKLPCADPEIYKGISHGWTKDGKPDPWTALDAQQKIVKFLVKHLGRTDGK